jgi:hypothetical protein
MIHPPKTILLSSGSFCRLGEKAGSPYEIAATFSDSQSGKCSETIQSGLPPSLTDIDFVMPVAVFRNSYMDTGLVDTTVVKR